MKLLILGAGKAQINSIKKAKSKGHTVIVSDYYPDAPGKELADYSELISTFDIEGNIAVGRKYDIDGVMTTGTDQPVYTAACVADELDLPSLINTEIARTVTNKREMKKIYTENNIPTVKYKIVDNNFADSELQDINFPVVIKPLDSQGQRGVYKLNSIGDIREHFPEVLSFSREEEILIEEYYESDEITVSGWVNNGQLHLLTVTDRITFDNPPHIGICSAHYFPSRFLSAYYGEIENVSLKIVNDFDIKNGPIYFQMLVGDDGIKVNEIACRVGGAYEDIFIPHLTGVDLAGMVIDSSLGKDINTVSLTDYNLAHNGKWFSVQLFYASPGKIEKLSGLGKIKNIPAVLDVDFNFSEGEEIANIENATERAGYFLVIANNRIDLKRNIEFVYDNLKIYNKVGENLILREIGEVLSEMSRENSI